MPMVAEYFPSSFCCFASIASDCILLPESSRFKNVRTIVGDENGKRLSDSLFELLKNTKLIYLYVLPVVFYQFCNWWNDLFLADFSVSHYGMTLSQAGSIVGSSYIGAVGYILSSAVGDFVLTRRNT